MGILASYWYFANADMRCLDGARVIADSGAFSSMSSGEPVDVVAYAAWLRRWRHRFAHYVNLDVIGDHEATASNQSYLEGQGLSPVPVFHVGSPMPVFEAMCERYEYIALGGMVPYKLRRAGLFDFCIDAHRIAERYDTRLHAFGHSNHDILRDLPWYSADSSTWTRTGMNAEVHLWDDRHALVRRVYFGGRMNQSRLARYRALIAEQLPIPIVDVLDPHFASPSKATSDEEAALRRAQGRIVQCVSIRSFIRFEAYMRQRHGTLTLRDSGDTGPHLYLVAANEDNARQLLEVINEGHCGDRVGRVGLGDTRLRAAR